jgi:hypothetical protein
VRARSGELDGWVWSKGEAVLALRSTWNVSTSCVYRLAQKGLLTIPTVCGSLHAEYAAHRDAVHERHARDCDLMRMRRAFKQLPPW